MHGRHAHHDAGFTMIEMVAVIVIISIAAGLTMVNLSAVSELAALRAAASRIRDLDRRGRLLAQAGEPTVLHAAPDQRAVELVIDDGELFTRVALPPAMTATLRIESAPIDGRDRVRFDAFGCSADYELVLSNPDRTLSWEVCGLTGAVLESGATP